MKVKKILEHFLQGLYCNSVIIFKINTRSLFKAYLIIEKCGQVGINPLFFYEVIQLAIILFV